MKEEYAIFFDDGAWILLRQTEFGDVTLREVCFSLEEAIRAASMLTGAMVGLKLITKQP